MIKHALAVALLGTGLGFTGHAPVRAAPLPSGVAVSSIRTADDTVLKVGCLDEVPVVNNVVAFFELLRDEEFDNLCLDRDYHDRRTYDERNYPSYKDGGYAEPKDLKARGKGDARVRFSNEKRTTKLIGDSVDRRGL